MLVIRCSSLPRLSACAASIAAPACRIEGGREPSDLGTAFHDCMKAVASGRAFDVALVAAEHNVERDDLAPMVGWAAKLWRERLAEFFSAPVVEEQAEYADDELTLTGKADLLAYVDGEVRGLDWKSGRLTPDAEAQLRGYALLGLQRWPDAERARMTVLNVRGRYADTLCWDRDELRAWWLWLKRHLSEADIYRTGKHCGHCPRALECPANETQLRTAALALPTVDAIDATDPETLADGVTMARVLAKRVEGFLEAVKSRVEAAGGTLGRLTIREQAKRSIDVRRGWNTLYELIGDDELMGMVKIGKGDVEKAIKDKAPARQKTAAVKDAMARLEADGAIQVSTTHILEVRHGNAATDGPAELAAAGDGSA